MVSSFTGHDFSRLACSLGSLLRADGIADGDQVVLAGATAHGHELDEIDHLQLGGRSLDGVPDVLLAEGAGGDDVFRTDAFGFVDTLDADALGQVRIPAFHPATATAAKGVLSVTLHILEGYPGNTLEHLPGRFVNMAMPAQMAGVVVGGFEFKPIAEREFAFFKEPFRVDAGVDDFSLDLGHIVFVLGQLVVVLKHGLEASRTGGDDGFEAIIVVKIVQQFHVAFGNGLEHALLAGSHGDGATADLFLSQIPPVDPDLIQKLGRGQDHVLKRLVQGRRATVEEKHIDVLHFLAQVLPGKILFSGPVSLGAPWLAPGVVVVGEAAQQHAVPLQMRETHLHEVGPQVFKGVGPVIDPGNRPALGFRMGGVADFRACVAGGTHEDAVHQFLGGLEPALQQRPDRLHAAAGQKHLELIAVVENRTRAEDARQHSVVVQTGAALHAPFIGSGIHLLQVMKLGAVEFSFFLSHVFPLLIA
ncbi:hypothetical protein DESC_40036 [Desulfosarcina cetonica]|nr:hypothetical protein DESC_40036 [Desulfosarcina cetonica]